MRIVITGGAGFLGTRLARKLLERGSLADAARQRRAGCSNSCCSTWQRQR